MIKTTRDTFEVDVESAITTQAVKVKAHFPTFNLWRKINDTLQMKKPDTFFEDLIELLGEFIVKVNDQKYDSEALGELVTARGIVEIANRLLEESSVKEAEIKKLELPPTSGRGESAPDAEETAPINRVNSNLSLSSATDATAQDATAVEAQAKAG